MQHIYIGDEGKGFPLVLDGELIDSDNTIFKKGNFITFEPESSHSSYTKTGCLLLVFQRAKNEPLKK